MTLIFICFFKAAVFAIIEKNTSIFSATKTAKLRLDFFYHQKLEENRERCIKYDLDDVQVMMESV